MANLSIDAPGLARRLCDKAGFTPEHAEEAAKAIAETIGDRVATRDDVALLRGALASAKTELRTEIAEVKADLTRLILTVATGQAALLLAAMFSIARFAR